jgi:hypothetical protein
MGAGKMGLMEDDVELVVMYEENPEVRTEEKQGSIWRIRGSQACYEEQACNGVSDERKYQNNTKSLRGSKL